MSLADAPTAEHPNMLRHVRTELERQIAAAAAPTTAPQPRLDLGNRHETAKLQKTLQSVTATQLLAERFYTFGGLSTWGQMSGCLGTIEALNRDKQQPRGRNEMWQLTLLTANLICSGQLLASNSTPAYISLAATARKLAYSVLGVNTGSAGLSCGSLLRQQQQQQQKQKQISPMQATTAIKALGDSIARLGVMMLRAGDSDSPVVWGTGSSGVGMSGQRIPNNLAAAQQLGTNVAGGPQGDTSGSPHHCSAPSAYALLHQLQAIQASSLVQVCEWLYKHQTKDKAPSTLRSPPTWLKTVQASMRQALTSGLDAATNQLLCVEVLSSPKAQGAMNVA
ncbi:MAG: hypothetical protein WDW38_011150 [Sanguina aurantia]